MIGSKNWSISAFLLLLAAFLPSALLANPVGQAVGVSQNAFLERGGSRGYLELGGGVFLGDVITTGSAGEVQLLFQDNTRIVVSPNSSLVIERILFSSSGTASQFTVNAVGGAFRFLSGNSSPAAYLVKTPNATMGIRGTAFDFAASRQSGLRVATFDGEVDLCNQAGQCVSVPGGCNVVAVDSSGRFIIPDGEEEEAALLQTGFPYVKSQRRLREDYRADVSECAESSVVQEGGVPTAPPAARQRNPNTGGARAGNDTSSGFGGSTAGDTDAGAGGPGGPGDADASGDGASAGGDGGASAGGGGVSAGGDR